MSVGRALGPALVAVGVFGTGVALAASFGLASATLTVSTYASSIPATTCTLSAADADSYVNQASPGSNFGGASTLQVRSGAGSNRRTFILFDLAPCSLPANSLITSANLKLFMNSAPAVSRTYDAHRVTGAWTEGGVTWTNQPTTAGSATASIPTGSSSNITLAWSVTADVQAFVDGATNRGWRVKDQTEDSATARASQFRPSEFGTASLRPVLEVTYYP